MTTSRDNNLNVFLTRVTIKIARRGSKRMQPCRLTSLDRGIIITKAGTLRLTNAIRRRRRAVSLISILFGHPRRTEFSMVGNVFFSRTHDANVHRRQKSRFGANLLGRVNRVRYLGTIVAGGRLMVTSLTFLQSIHVKLHSGFTSRSFRYYFSFCYAISAVGPRPSEPLFSYTNTTGTT